MAAPRRPLSSRDAGTVPLEEQLPPCPGPGRHIPLSVSVTSAAVDTSCPEGCGSEPFRPRQGLVWGRAVPSTGEQDRAAAPLLWGGAGSGLEPARVPQYGCPWPLLTGPSSSRLFSLQVPAPPKIFLSLVYKLEGPSNVEVALELTTGDVGSCHVGGVSALNGEGRSPPSRGISGRRAQKVQGSRGAGGAGPSCLCC